MIDASLAVDRPRPINHSLAVDRPLLTIRDGVQWYVSRSVPANAAGITRVECRIGPAPTEQRRAGFCHGCRHDVVVFTDRNDDDKRTFKSLTADVVHALKTELGFAWTGFSCVHFMDNEMRAHPHCGGDGGFKKADLKRARELIASVRAPTVARLATAREQAQNARALERAVNQLEQRGSAIPIALGLQLVAARSAAAASGPRKAIAKQKPARAKVNANG